jgi:hypothetical protein
MNSGRPDNEGSHMTATDSTADALRELAHRVTDGVEVVLFWNSMTHELTVCVCDDRAGSYFELATEPDRALDVFYHPYSYAAFQGVPYEDELLPSWAHAASAPTPLGAGPS